MPTSSPRGPAQARDKRRKCTPLLLRIGSLLAVAVAGGLATVFVFYGIGAALYGHRSSWRVGQGEGFRVYLVSFYAAPFAAIYWLGAAWVASRGQPPWRYWLAAITVYLVLGLLLHLAADPG